MMKKLAGLMAFLVILAPSVMAQPQLPDPGITPDSPFYFMDRAFDRFQSSEAVADERAAEIEAMAEKNKTRAMERAVEGYERAMRRRTRDVNKSAGLAEEVARQASNHLSVLARVREQVSEQARKGIENAINNSARGRQRAIEAVNRTNRERARVVAQNTLEEVMANAPEQARQGLQRAIEAVGKKREIGPRQNQGQRPTGQNNENGNKPEENGGQKPDNTSKLGTVSKRMDKASPK